MARAVHGSDGRGHIEYDIVIANAFTVPVRLESIQVSTAGRRLLTLRGAALAGHTLELDKTTATVPVSGFVKTLLDVVLPRAFGRGVPRTLSQRIRYAIPDAAPVRQIIGSTVVRGPTVRVVRQAPIRIASPVYGRGWLDSSGCCADPTSEHRTLLLPTDGAFRTPEMFSIDWIREAGGVFFKGSGTKRSDWVAFGAPIHAVAAGVVVSAVNTRPEVPPFIPLADNRTVRGPMDFGGNIVVERIAQGQYAFYAHLQTGSVRVTAGPGRITISGRPRHVTLSEPLVRGVFSF